MGETELVKIPVRMVAEHVYCPRLYYLMHVEGIFVESKDTVEGTSQHKRTEPASAAGKDEEFEARKPHQLELGSEQLGITGKLDALGAEGEQWVPVEYKHGPAPESTRQFTLGDISLASGIWDNDQIQLGAQMMLLAENGYQCKKGRIYYRQTKTSVELPFTDILVAAVNNAVGEARKTYIGAIPPPLIDSPKCVRCSLNVVCLPDEINTLTGKADQEPRKLIPGRDDKGILHITAQGGVIGKSHDCIVVRTKELKLDRVPIKDVAHVSLYGNVQVTTQLMNELLRRHISVAYFSAGGWFNGMASPAGAPNVILRREQFRKLSIDEIRLKLAREIVCSKILNQRVMITRNGQLSRQDKGLMKRLAMEAKNTLTLEKLRGIEGKAAAVYFDNFQSMIKAGNGSFKFTKRNRRPPKDPINALLSFAYSLLCRELTATLAICGLDPAYGFYHDHVPGRPALALDMMEAFRPLIADSVVLRAVNTGMVAQKHFAVSKASAGLLVPGRRKFIEAYESRMDEMATHPVMGYRLSYRRLLDLESRLLGRFLSGELKEYKPMVTR